MINTVLIFLGYRVVATGGNFCIARSLKDSSFSIWYIDPFTGALSELLCNMSLDKARFTWFILLNRGNLPCQQ